jgi:hypothetical protein
MSLLRPRTVDTCGSRWWYNSHHFSIRVVVVNLSASCIYMLLSFIVGSLIEQMHSLIQIVLLYNLGVIGTFWGVRCIFLGQPSPRGVLWKTKNSSFILHIIYSIHSIHNFPIVPTSIQRTQAHYPSAHDSKYSATPGSSTRKCQ